VKPHRLGVFTAAFAAILSLTSLAFAQSTLLNVSYDPTRELYRDIAPAFARSWQAAGHPAVTVKTSNGGSGAQARAVIDGLPADVVTLGLAGDIDAIAKRGLIAPDWQKRLPDNATPYTSTIVFLVRKGNPKAIHDWPDLIRPGVAVITPNPKTSGGARWNYLAAWLWALHQPGGTEATATQFLTKLYRQVPVLDAGARGATNTFVQRGIGDVLLAWENEALLASRDVGAGQFDIVYPSASIRAEPPVAVVDRVVDQHGTRPAAEAFLRFLFSPEGQRIGAKHYFRPQDPKVLAANAATFPRLTLYDIASLGGWSTVQPKHFGDGGLFDHIYTPGK
jgi:sulfate/thiosulfate transport system substrate-binding protein